MPEADGGIVAGKGLGGGVRGEVGGDIGAGAWLCPGFCEAIRGRGVGMRNGGIAVERRGGRYFPGFGGICEGKRHPGVGGERGTIGVLAEEVEVAVSCIVEGRYELEEREMLQVEVDGKKIPGVDYALNEVGIQKAATSSLLKIHAYIGDIYLTTYWADGLVVATPTGSTAYSMSGGGPIVSPDCRNVILTPICPHNLSMRPLVLPSDAEVVLKVESRSGSFILSTDSRCLPMSDACRLIVRRNGVKLHVANLPGHNYYETLRNKLKWGEDRRNEI